MAELVLPPRRLVPSIYRGPDEHLAELIYHPVTGLVYRWRFRQALEALESAGPCTELLEVGYGAGLLLPSLAGMCRAVEAVDVHSYTQGVQQMLTELHLTNVRVGFGSILDLPYTDGRFGQVLCVSVLEHFRELDRAVSELARVTVAGGSVVLGFPTKNIVTKALFRLVGYEDDVIHPSSHRQILDAVRRVMDVDRVWRLPHGAPLDLSLYVVARCKVRS